MEENEDEKRKVLESIRLQDEALSLRYKTSLVNLDDLVDSDEEAECNTNVRTTVEPRQHDIGTKTSCRVEENDEEPTISSALSANLEYDKELGKLEDEIRSQLERVNKQIQNLDEKIKSWSSHGRFMKKNSKSNWLYVFGIPYFKDHDFYPCPPNEDYKIKQANNEVCWVDLPVVHQWMPEQKKRLISAIETLSYERCVADAEQKLKGMKQKVSTLESEGLSAEAQEIGAVISSFNVEEEAKKNLQFTIENGPHDWMHIANRYLDGGHPASSCEAFWKLYLHPKINKSPWSEDERRRLKEIAKRHKFENWDLIAEQLNTNRSGYQCFITYQTKLSAGVARNRWTEKEDVKLFEVVEKCRIGDYIPWGKVSFYMDGRTKAQIFNRWTYSLNPSIKKGRFSRQEDILIIVGVQMWGEAFQRIANFMQDRTTSQVRDRYRNYLGKGDLGIPWTSEDDQLLMSLVPKYGRDWSKIAQHFPNKDRTQTRHRYTTLHRWQEKNPDKDLSEVPARILQPPSCAEHPDLWEKARNILTSSTSADDVAKSKEKLSSYIKNAKKKVKVKKSNKKPTLAESDLINFFRCSYNIPGGRKKSTLRLGEAECLADELQNFLELMDASLCLPSSEEMENDNELSDVDREILEELRKLQLEISKESHQEVLEKCDTQSSSDILLSSYSNTCFSLFDEESSDPGPSTVLAAVDPAPSGASDQHSDLQPSEKSSNIDYKPPPGYILSTYIDLPLLNFTQDEVVVDIPLHLNFPEDSTINTARPVHSVRPVSPIVDSKSDEKSYICPPNFTTLIGLRTFLLNRRTLAERELMEPTRPRFIDVNAVGDDKKFVEACRKFEKRLLFLFLWPAIMSRTAPENISIFYDDSSGGEEGSAKAVPASERKNFEIVHKSRKRKVSGSKRNVKNVAASEKGLLDSNHPEPKRIRLDAEPVAGNTDGPASQENHLSLEEPDVPLLD